MGLVINKRNYFDIKLDFQRSVGRSKTKMLPVGINRNANWNLPSMR